MKAKHLKSPIAFLIGIALLLGACGKNNTVGTSSGSSALPNTTTNAYSGTSLGHSATVNAELTKVMNQVNCSYGGSRVRVNFSTKGQSYNQSLTTGPFTKGNISGSIAAEFMGVSAFGDVLVVSRMTSGSTVIGHNIALYLCPANNSYTNAQIIGASTKIDNFTDYNQGIVLDSNSGCPAGNVDSAYTGITSSGYYDGQYYIDTQFGPYCQ